MPKTVKFRFTSNFRLFAKSCRKAVTYNLCKMYNHDVDDAINDVTKHMFHVSCLWAWKGMIMATGNALTCPYCRREVANVAELDLAKISTTAASIYIGNP